MAFSFQRLSLSNANKLNLICLAALIWMAVCAWSIAWPLTWGSLPIGLVLGYAIVRILFELTLNRANIPTMATCFVTRQKIAHLLSEEVKRSGKDGYTVLDMGSGRGELAHCIAKMIPSAKVKGFELARMPYLESSLIQRFLGPKNLSYERCDFWQVDCAHADAVVLYLGPTSTQRMGEKLNKELPAGSLVFANTYPLLGPWTPSEILTFHSPFKETVYAYRK